MDQWIAVYESLPEHPKCYQLADRLGIEIAHGVGIVCCLWLWASRHAADGRLSEFPDRAIARACRYGGDAGALVEALTASGFLDGDRRLHEWDVYAGYFAEREQQRREKERLRKRRQRARAAEADVPRDSGDGGGTVTPPTPTSTVTMTYTSKGGGFERFWAEYPRKVNKAAARQAWEALAPDGALEARIAAGLARSRQLAQWNRDAGRYIPYPASYLNGRRWEDESEEAADNGSSGGQDALAGFKRAGTGPVSGEPGAGG